MHGIEKEITGLHSYLDGLIEKKNSFQDALLLSYDEDKKFALIKRVKALEKEILWVRVRIDNIGGPDAHKRPEKISSNLSLSSTSNPKKAKSVPKKVFISYSKEDRSYLEELKRHLASLVKTYEIVLFDESTILPGEDWDTKLREELVGADLILMLVSANFIASDYVWEIEVPNAMELHKSGIAIVIPILVSPCIWDNMPFSMLDPLPGKALSVSEFADRNEAWLEVAKGVKRVIEYI